MEPTTPQPAAPRVLGRTAITICLCFAWFVFLLGALVGLAAIAIVVGGGYCVGLILGVIALAFVKGGAAWVINLNTHSKLRKELDAK